MPSFLGWLRPLFMAMTDHLTNLHRLLTQPIGPHLADERLAEMAAVEATGKDVAIHYGAEVAHMEVCPECATHYNELVLMTLTAVSQMSAAARAVTPQEVFAALLQRDMAEPVEASIVQEVAAALPLLFIGPPTSAEEFDLALAATSFPERASDVISAARRNLATLAAYLVGAAEAVWGKELEVRTAVSAHKHHLQFQPAPALAIPTLSSQATGDEWVLLSRPIGQPQPWHVAARARRYSALVCTLTVHVDRPGLADASERRVAIEYGGQMVTAVTDTNGTATFIGVPIAALATLVITFNE
jgi:hypothetical protein